MDAGRVIVEAAAAADSPGVGGKAAALGRLARAGFDVPPFFVITGEVGADILDAALGRIGPGPFAVRSSGLQEDGAAHSHAGQFASLLNVPRAAVPEAIAEVIASNDQAGLAAYRATRGLDGAGDRPAVIVQEMVPASHAGVAFSADPVSGRRDRIVVSATAGLADRLVSGEIDGSSWWIDAASGAAVDSSGDADLLAPEALGQVVDLVRRVEHAHGSAQDIEWAIADGRLRLLQARPITSLLRPAPLADPRVAVFDNSNIVESYPGLVSPLTFSFASYAYARVYTSFVTLLGVRPDIVRANRVVFENMLVRVNGRVYYNLGNWFRALALLPGYNLNRGYMETMMGVGAPLPAEVMSGFAPAAATGGRAREYARLPRMGFGLLREAIRLPATADGFRARLDRALAATAPDKLAAMPLTALAAEYRRIEGDLLDRWDAPIVNDFLCMIAFGASRKLLERWMGPAGLVLHNDVLIGQGDIISARPAQLIRAMGARAAGDPAIIAALERGDRAAIAADPALSSELAAYVAEFGDRCTEELKLESVTLDEDPGPLHAAVAAAARAGSPAPPRARDPFAALNRGLRNPAKRLVARWALRWAKARVRDRENLRYERTRIFGRARRLLLAAGRQFRAHGLLADPRDVFLLTIQEILGVIEGFATSIDLAAIADLRRREMAAAATTADPPERIFVTGPAFTASTLAAVPVVSDGSTERIGTGCSAGIATAVARVIRDPRTQSLAAGEILVARHTDPGWIALFASASAIVVERGSLLSHSAIVARELGIPCVVGCKDATSWICDGERIEVDGATGRVRKLGA
jgi:pyruvate,water dikinase